MNRKRKQLTKKHVTAALDRVKKQLSAKIAKRGMGRYGSVHEIYGIVAEEFDKELLDAMHANNYTEFENELVDVIIGCLWGLASMKSLRESKIY